MKNKFHTDSLNGLVTTLAALFIAVGLALWFLVPQFITLAGICYVFAAAVVVCGIVLIVRYFMSEGYKNIHEYGFSAGVLLTVAGLLALIKAQEMSQWLIVAMGCLMLLASVFKLQTALDLRAIGDKLFWLWLVITVIFVGCAAVIIIDPFTAHDETLLITFAQFSLIADGIATLASVIYLWLRLRHPRKEEKDPADEMTEAIMAENDNPEAKAPEQDEGF